jgi:hypothetical protein
LTWTPPPDDSPSLLPKGPEEGDPSLLPQSSSICVLADLPGDLPGDILADFAGDSSSCDTYGAVWGLRDDTTL